jgi:hypothetical protein
MGRKCPKKAKDGIKRSYDLCTTSNNGKKVKNQDKEAVKETHAKTDSATTKPGVAAWVGGVFGADS